MNVLKIWLSTKENQNEPGLEMTKKSLARNEPGQWYVYIIEADDGSWYTGVTTDIQRRFKEHTTGAKGARYFRGRQPKTVIFTEGEHTRASACQREAQIKKLNRAQKQIVVATQAGKSD